MKRFALTLAILALCVMATAQTRTVAKTGTPDHSTLQAAIDFFDPDPDAGTANVIQILDDGSYDEIITIDVPVTIEGTGPNRPIILAQTNPASAGANDGILISIPTGTFNDVTLRNLILIPSLTTPPADDGIASVGQNLNILMENVLVSPNNGAGQPLSLDGLTEVDTTGATLFGDDGIFVGGTTTPAGNGTQVVLRDVVITHVPGDGIVCSASGTSYTIEDGCVFSFCGRLGIQGNQNFIINAPNNRVWVLGNKGFAGIWFPAPGTAPVPTTRSINGCNVIGNGIQDGDPAVGTGWGIEQQNGGGMPFTLSNAIIADNAEQGLLIGAVTVTAPITITNVTIANNGDNAIETDATLAASATITITDSVIAGNGTGPLASNAIENNGLSTLTINDSAVVTAGSFALAAPGTSGAGTIVQNNVINVDPAFIETSNLSDPKYFWTSNPLYSIAGSGNSPLGGGAGHESIIPTAADRTWEMYQ